MSIQTTGKRKTAKARVSLEEGRGKLKINKETLKSWPDMPSLKIEEPLRIASDLADKVNIKVNVNGGGVMSQAEAIRMAIARALVEYSDGKELENKFLDYDRNMLVEDYRRTETRKPSQSSKGARHKRQKSYR